MANGIELMESTSFEIQGPDDVGCAWICSPPGDDAWRHNLGQAGIVADAMARWLQENDFGDRIYHVMRYVTDPD